MWPRTAPCSAIASIVRSCAKPGGARAGICCAPTFTDDDPARLRSLYLQLVSVEEAFRNLKGDLAIRPIFHQDQARIEAHIFIAFLAYCLHVTLGRRLHALAPGLTPRRAIEKFAAVQMIDLHVPTTDGRELLKPGALAVPAVTVDGPKTAGLSRRSRRWSCHGRSCLSRPAAPKARFGAGTRADWRCGDGAPRPRVRVG
jgi:hypothetical protein